jgi:SWIM zinc finger
VGAGPREPEGARPTAPEPAVIRVYALLETSTGAGAWGTRILTPSTVHAVVAGHRRFGRSRRRLEQLALERAFEDVAAMGVREVTVEIADPRANAWLAQLETGGPSGAPGMERLRALVAPFVRLTVHDLPALDDPALLGTVERMLEQELHGATRTRTRRTRSIESILASARAVALEPTATGFLANGRYTVTLDPPECSCPSWRRRWAGVPLAGRRAARLPCKHLAAAAVRAGRGTPRELEQLVRRART